MKIIDAERIVRRGAGSLAESLHFCGHSHGDNEVPESNVALHLGRAFLDEGFLAFSAAHTKNSVKVHLDLLAVQPRTQILFAGEFKRLYNSAQVAKLVDDLPRIQNFEPQDVWTHPGLKIEARVGLLAGTIYNADYAQ